MRRLALSFLSIAVLLSTAALSSCARAPATSAHTASPEEAVIALLPYRLGAQDAIPGYTVRTGAPAQTPVTLSASDPSPQTSFAAWNDAGLIVRFWDRLVPPAQASAAPNEYAIFEVSLFTGPCAAASYAGGRTLQPRSDTEYRVELVKLRAHLGDSSAAWHFTRTLPGKPSQGSYWIRWQRGEVAFDVATLPQPLGQERQADAESLAAVLEKTEQARPPVRLGPATVTPPVSEQQRLQATLQLKPFFIGADAAPGGYAIDEGYSRFADPAEYVASEPDHVAALHTVDEDWRWLARAREIFTNKENSDLTFMQQATLCADARSAAADAAGFTATTAGWTSSRSETQVGLGESTYAYRASGPDANGNPAEGGYLYWTHGALVLSAGMYGPAGTTSMDQLAALAQQIEARYQENPLQRRACAGPEE